MEQKGANNLEVRRTNIRRIFNLLYQRNEMTKQDIANTLQLSLPTVGQIVKELTERGFVREAGTVASSGGRKPVLNALVYDARLSVGIEITQNHLRFVVSDLAGRAMHHLRVRERFENTEHYFQRLGERTERFLSDQGVEREQLLGVGIAIPGIVQKQKGLVEFAPTLGVRNLPIETITRFLPYPVCVDNEASLAGFAEVWGREQLRDAVFLSLNKGIGGAIMMGNRLYPGSNWRAGEFGHMTIVKDGKRCACGKQGCLEAYCSTTVLSNQAEGGLDHFFTEMEKGNEQYLLTWDDYLDDLAIGINNLRMIFDAEVIIGGDIDVYLAKYLSELLERLYERNSFSDHTPYVHISKYGSMASAVGAALLPVDDFISNI